MIFVNYRRDDSTATAGRLHDRLAQRFGRKTLFMDIDHIPPGVDFVTHLNNQVAACDVFLAIIGPNWLNVTNEKGERRLDTADDFVAIEIAAALARNIRVIPVLVEGARMPKLGELPKSLKPLARRQAIDLGQAQFGRDAEALIEKISEALGEKPVKVDRWRVAAGIVVALLLLGGIGLFATGMSLSPPWAVQPDRRAQPEKERLAAVQAGEDRKAKAAAEAEARRKSEEAERQRLAALRAEEEGRKQAEAGALVNQSSTAFNNGDYDRAIASASEAMRLDPKNALAFTNRGAAYGSKGDFDRAIADYTEAIRLNPNYAVAFNNRGVAYGKKGDFDRAIADYTEVIRLNPSHALAFFKRGLEYVRKGDFDGNADIAKARQLDASICR
jgi:tetratricopeptide (TPR) repeat protein